MNKVTNLREENNQLVTECRELFWHLIDLTGNYYLSDCVEEAADLLSDDEENRFIHLRNVLSAKCEEMGINFHQISLDVATEFLKSQKKKLTVQEVIKGLTSLYKQLSEESDLDIIENAVSLIKTHCVED